MPRRDWQEGGPEWSMGVHFPGRWGLSPSAHAHICAHICSGDPTLSVRRGLRVIRQSLSPRSSHPTGPILWGVQGAMGAPPSAQNQEASQGRESWFFGMVFLARKPPLCGAVRGPRMG